MEKIAYYNAMKTKMSEKQIEYPILKLHLSDGTIFIDSEEYIGHASDGIDIRIGSVGDEGRAEEYLKDCPNPTDW